MRGRGWRREIAGISRIRRCFAWLLILIKSRSGHLGRLGTVWFFEYLRKYGETRVSVTRKGWELTT
jgi:hypothetical protein